MPTARQPQASHRARLAGLGRKIGHCQQPSADFLTFELMKP